MTDYKEKFEKMSVSQQEQIYQNYSRKRLSGKTDAYGNTIVRGDDGRGGNQVVTAPAKTMAVAQAPTTAEVSQSAATDVTEDNILLRKRKIKAKWKSPTILTGVTGPTGSLTLGKPSLLGRA